MIKINQRFEYFIFCDNLNKEIKEKIIKFKKHCNRIINCNSSFPTMWWKQKSNR